MPVTRTAIVLLLLCALFTPGPSVRAQTLPSLFDHYHAQGDTLQIYLDTDFTTLVRRKHEKEYQHGHVRLVSLTSEQTFTTEIRTRGNVRLEVCTLPALKLKLPKKALTEAGYSDLNEWKIVLPCSDSRQGTDYLWREKFAYDLYALLNPTHHLRTLPAVLHLPEDRHLSVFLVEHPEQLATRFGGQPYPHDKLSSRALDQDHYTRLCLFNYLIANTDFNVFNLHNLAVISRPDSLYQLAFPYDFDYSGLVGTSYSIPHESIDIESVYERSWRGRHVSVDEILEEVQYFESRRDEVFALIADYNFRSERENARIKRMVEGFYGVVGNRKRFKRLLAR